MGVKKLSGGIVKRRQQKALGVFIDGVGLDRATRRLNKKIDLSNLLRGVTSGLRPTVARYYTIVPNEDDSRQRAFLDAVSRAGMDVVVKRLPPKGVNRHVSIDIEMAADIVAFSMGLNEFAPSEIYRPVEDRDEVAKPTEVSDINVAESTQNSESQIKRIVTIVCPSKELSYPIGLIADQGIDTVSADFGQYNAKDVLRSAAKWIDLSGSETIWRD